MGASAGFYGVVTWAIPGQYSLEPSPKNVLFLRNEQVNK